MKKIIALILILFLLPILCRCAPKGGELSADVSSEAESSEASAEISAEPSKPEHIHDYTSETTLPTAERGGFTLHTCVSCGESYTDNISEPLAPSQGLEFGVIDGKCFIKGIGSCTDAVLVLPSRSPEGKNVTLVGDYAFFGNTAVTAVYLQSGITTVGSFAFSQCPALSAVCLSSTVTGVGDNAFEDSPRLAEIDFPDAMHQLGEYALDGTAWLALNPDGLVVAGRTAYTFKGDLPEDGAIVLGDELVGIAGSAFSGLALKSVTVGEGITTIGNGAFSGCVDLEAITLPASVTQIGDNAFFGCTGLAALEFKGQPLFVGLDAFKDTAWLESLPDGLVIIGKCCYLQKGEPEDDTAVIPDGVISISPSAFANCTTLRYLTLPQGLEYIGEQAFLSCSRLRALVLPEGLRVISAFAFSGCSRVPTLYIPASVETVGYGILTYCIGLNEVEIAASEPPVGWSEYWNQGLRTSIPVVWGAD